MERMDVTTSRAMDDKLHDLIELEDIGVLVGSEATPISHIIRDNLQEGWEVGRDVAEVVDGPLNASMRTETTILARGHSQCDVRL